MTSAGCGTAGEAANHQHRSLRALEREALLTLRQALSYLGDLLQTERASSDDLRRAAELASVLMDVPALVARGRSDFEREHIAACLARARALMAL